jgi:hypothetical protein
MRSLAQSWVLLNLSAALLVPSVAAADPIQITSGFVELGGAFELVGDERAFRLIGRGYGGGASPSAYAICGGDECNAGEVRRYCTLSAVWICSSTLRPLTEPSTTRSTRLTPRRSPGSASRARTCCPH